MMAFISRIRSQWTGIAGGPGVTTMYTTDHAAFVPMLQDFWAAATPPLPNEVSVKIEGAGDVILDSTGELGATWTFGDSPAAVGTQAGVWAAPVGLCINWLTDDVEDGRRVRGKSYIVPLSAGQMEINGFLQEASRAAYEGWAQDLVDAASGIFLVWHRPKGDPPVGGSSHAVTQAVVSNKLAVLRSRRD